MTAGIPCALPDGVDRHDVRVATGSPDALAGFNLAGVLDPTDVHAATTLCRLTGDARPETLLAAALAVRAPRHGHVCLDLTTVATTVTAVDDAPVELDTLDWPDPSAWRKVLCDSPLVTVRPAGVTTIDPDADRPLTMVGDLVYLDRYWRYERRVAEVLRRRAVRGGGHVDPAALRPVLDRLLPPSGERPDRQRLAAATAALRTLTVIAGGPGTGKTHTVARLLALLHELAGGHTLRVAVAAPTGKAADRLTEALREAADEVATSTDVRDRLRSLEASTLHRLLGWSPRSETRFRHDRFRRLPHEVVVVDETSMVSLSLMAKLLAAMRPSAQLVLVGDPDQLESVEAGAVLGDIVGVRDTELRLSPDAREELAAATGEPLDAVPPATTSMDDAVVVLGTVRRYRSDSGIAALAEAIHAGDADATVRVLEEGHHDLTWLPVPGDAEVSSGALTPVRAVVGQVHSGVHGAASRGDADEALSRLGRLRVLCAHRRGPVGVAAWGATIEQWLSTDVAGYDPNERWYAGRPVLVTHNDRRLRLYNGDVGVVVRTGDGPRVAFRGPQGPRLFGPSRLEAVETVHAMTIHKAQGSQFDHVVLVLPDESSPILTRELLYTAVTRARRRVTVVGPTQAVRHAVHRRVGRASGLRDALWGEPSPTDHGRPTG